VLITGTPGIGKTSLISRLYRDLVPLLIRGFYKEGVHENSMLKGYRIISFDFQELILAHRHIVGPDRLGEFGINLDGFDQLVSRQLFVGKEVELFLIDEIGTMECLSASFRQKILDIMDSDIPLIATLASMDVLETLEIKQRNDISILQMTMKNRESLWKEVLIELSKPHI